MKADRWGEICAVLVRMDKGGLKGELCAVLVWMDKGGLKAFSVNYPLQMWDISQSKQGYSGDGSSHKIPLNVPKGEPLMAFNLIHSFVCTDQILFDFAVFWNKNALFELL